jgi:membrane protein DedA with SNARE-associated domain
MLTYAGVQLGRNWRHIDQYSKYLDIIAMIAVIAFIIWIVYRNRAKLSHREKGK